MATKAEMAAELSTLTGEEVNPESYKADELEQMLKDAKASADTSSAPEDTSSAQNSSQSDEGKVSAYLGASSPAGRLVIGGVTQRQGGLPVTLRRLRVNEDPANAAVTITREQLEQYAKEYDIKVVEG